MTRRPAVRSRSGSLQCGTCSLRKNRTRGPHQRTTDLNAGTNSGDGLNLRSGMLTPGLGMVATEVIIRTHTHLAAYRASGDPRLGKAAAAKRNEMLLAAHAAAG